MERIKETVDALLKDLLVKRSQTGGLTTEELGERVFSRKEKGHIRVVSVRKTVIRCAVESSSWLYYFSLKKAELLTAFQAVVPEASEIRLSMDRQQPRAASGEQKTLH